MDRLCSLLEEVSHECLQLSTGESIGLGTEWGGHWFGCESSSHEMVPKEGQETEMGHGPGVETQGDTEDTEGGDTEKSAGGA